MQKYQNQFELHSICADIYQGCTCEMEKATTSTASTTTNKKPMALSAMKIGKSIELEKYFADHLNNTFFIFICAILLINHEYFSIFSIIPIFAPCRQ